MKCVCIIHVLVVSNTVFSKVCISPQWSLSNALKLGIVLLYVYYYRIIKKQVKATLNMLGASISPLVDSNDCVAPERLLVIPTYIINNYYSS